MNPQSLLEQFLGPNAGKTAGNAVESTKNKLAGSGLGGVAGGLAAGELLGVLLGNKKARKKVGKLAGGVVGYGGAAALGALAFRAYQNWQSGQQAPQTPRPFGAADPAAAGRHSNARSAAGGVEVPSRRGARAERPAVRARARAGDDLRRRMPTGISGRTSSARSSTGSANCRSMPKTRPSCSMRSAIRRRCRISPIWRKARNRRPSSIWCPAWPSTRTIPRKRPISRRWRAGSRYPMNWSAISRARRWPQTA